MLKLTKKTKATFFLTIMLVGMFFALAPNQAQAKTNAVGLELSSTSGTVGFPVSVHCTGLTDGTVYLVVAVTSGGNVTAVTSGSGTEDYVTLLFTSADSDGVVPIHIGTTTDYTSTAAYTATVIYTLNAPSIPGSQFFTGIIGPLVIIAVVVGLAGIFAFKKFRK